MHYARATRYHSVKRVFWRAASVASILGTVLATALATALALPGSAWSQAGGAADQELLYRACLNQARADPENAYRAALDWHQAGGGLPARHCAAVALLGLNAYDEAASRLETLAGEVPDARLDLRLGLMAQAAQGWMMSGRAARAEQLLSRVISVQPNDPQILADRAVARLSLRDYWGAVDDLDRSIQMAPRDVELLLYRASAYRYLGVPDLARDDVERALAVNPIAPAAWLERGILEQMAGDDTAARRSWIRVLDLAPESSTADAARARIEALDVTR